MLTFWEYFEYCQFLNKTAVAIFWAPYAKIWLHFFKWANLGLLFSFFSKTKSVGFSVIRTRIVGVEDKHTDHLTTTTAQIWLHFIPAFVHTVTYLRTRFRMQTNVNVLNPFRPP